MSQQAIALWRSQIPAYQRIISRCCYRVLTPLSEFPPPDFDDKIQQFRQILSVKQPQSYDNYIDVIAHYLEGKKNKSNIQLADYFAQEFGGSLKYWQNVILDVAEPITYTSDLTVWHVRKIFEEKLYVDAENLSNYRRLCRLTKTYLSAIVNLIKYISKFDTKKDTLAKVDDLFKKVKSAQEKYVGFSEQINMFEKSATFDELSNNVSQKSKQNALKNMYHFKQPARTKNQKSRNTLFNYNFQVKNKEISERASEPTKNLRQVNKQLPHQKMMQFEKVIKNVSSQKEDLSKLRDQFKSAKEPEKGKKTSFPINYTTIYDKDYHFSYLSHPIQLHNFDAFTSPFVKHEFVNYQINSDDQYQDLIGEDVGNNSDISSVSEISRTSFVVSDGHLSDDQDVDRANKELKPTISTAFGDRWSFNSKAKQGSYFSKIENFAIILVDSKLKFPIQVNQKSELEQALIKIVDGKDKTSILSAISKQKIKISKAKLNEFLSKKCKTVKETNPNRTIYKILQFLQESNQQQPEKENESNYYKPEVGDDQDKEDPQDTGFYDSEHFSENFRMQTRRSKKQSSERLGNKKVEELGRITRSRKSAQEGSQLYKKSV